MEHLREQLEVLTIQNEVVSFSQQGFQPNSFFSSSGQPKWHIFAHYFRKSFDELTKLCIHVDRRIKI